MTNNLVLVLMDESGDTNISLKKKKGLTRYFIAMAVIVPPQCYMRLFDLDKIVEHAIRNKLKQIISSIDEDRIIKITKKLRNVNELKTKSVTEILAEELRDLGFDERRKSDVIDSILAEIISDFKTRCPELSYLTVYVDKADIAREIRNNVDTLLMSYYVEMVKIIVRRLTPLKLREALCNYLDHKKLNAIAIYDEKMFDDIGKDDIPRKIFNCTHVIEAIEVKSHHLIGMSISDIFAGAYRNMLLHDSNYLIHELTQGIEYRELELTKDILALVRIG